MAEETLCDFQGQAGKGGCFCLLFSGQAFETSTGFVKSPGTQKPHAGETTWRGLIKMREEPGVPATPAPAVQVFPAQMPDTWGKKPLNDPNPAPCDCDHMRDLEPETPKPSPTQIPDLPRLRNNKAMTFWHELLRSNRPPETI